LQRDLPELLIQCTHHLSNKRVTIGELLALQSIVPVLDASLYDSCLLIHIPIICNALGDPSVTIRHQVISCIVAMARVNLSLCCRIMNMVVVHIIDPLSSQSNGSGSNGIGNIDLDDIQRLGRVVALHALLTQLDPLSIVPYLAFFIIPLLGGMSDPSIAVRQTSSLSFAAAVRLLPLEPATIDPVEMSISLRERRSRERTFVTNLLDGTKLTDVTIATGIKAELRRYQHEGINWLWFLHQSNLHGILCDDMGLGKTLQTICLLANAVQQAKQNTTTKSSRSTSGSITSLPCLVVCPSTIVAHWTAEIAKFCESSTLSAIAYQGTPEERQRVRACMAVSSQPFLPSSSSSESTNISSSSLSSSSRGRRYDIFVTSFQILRSDVKYLKHFQWNYCVLDEGHIIKNDRSKISIAAKSLRCKHRFVCTVHLTIVNRFGVIPFCCCLFHMWQID
jgi:TATA-binding protein-associated factor